MSGLFGGTNAKQASILKGLRAQTSVYGSVIPIVYGRTRVPGNVIWYGDWKAIKQKAQGGKGGLFGGGGKGGTTYNYQAAIAIAIAVGPCQRLNNLFDSLGNLTLTPATQQFTVPGGGGSVTVTNGAHFYGDDGVTRGDAYSFVSNDYGNPNNPVTQSGTNQTPMTVVVASPGAGQYTVNTTTGQYTFSSADAGKVMTISYLWAQPTSTGAASAPITLAQLTFFAGGQGQSPWGYLTTNHPSVAIGYTGICYVASSAMNLGGSGTAPNLTYELSGLLPFTGGIPDSNPRDVVYDLLTNPLYGLGYPPEEIADLTAYSNYCVASGLFISPVLDTDQPANEWIQPILDATNSAAFISGGRLQIAPYGDSTVVGFGATYTPNTTPVYDLADDDFVDIKGQDPILVQRPTIADVFNNVKVEYLNRANNYNAEIIEEFDQNSIEIYRKRQTSPTQLHFFTTAGSAQTSANNTLRRQVYIRRTFTFTLDERYVLLDPMDLVTLTDSNLGFSKLPVRITDIKETQDGKLEVTAEDFPWGTATATAYPKQTGLPFVPSANADPGLVNPPPMFEALSRLNDQIGHAIWMGISGANQNWGGCTIWASTDGAAYKAVGVLFSSARMGLLTALFPSNTDPDTTDTLSVDLTESFGSLSSGSQADCDNFRTLCYVGNTENLLQQSEQFGTAPWTTDSSGTSVVQNNVTAPDGNVTADTVTAGAANGNRYQPSGITSATTDANPYTFSIWLKVASGTQQVTLFIDRATGSDVESTTVTVGTTWQRFSFTHSTTWTGASLIRAGIVVVSNGAAIQCWGAQLERNGQAGGYQVTTSAAASQGGELVSYQTANLTATYMYNLTTRLRRGVFNSTISAHSFAAQFARLDENMFSFDYDPTLIGTRIFFKFTSFNLFGQREQGLVEVPAYTFAITGKSLGLLTPAHITYRPTSNPLTGHDAGSSATINIASFSMRIPGIPDITENSGAVTGLSYNTLYYVYFDDPGFAGGSVTYQVTTTKEVALNSAGRFFVGSIQTPRSTFPDTIGNDDGGSGAQSGMVTTFWLTSISTYTNSTAGNGTASNQTNCTDGFPGSVATYGVTGNGSSTNNAFTDIVAKSLPITRRVNSITVKILWSVPTNNLNGPGGSGRFTIDVKFFDQNGVPGVVNHVVAVGPNSVQPLQVSAVTFATNSVPTAVDITINAVTVAGDTAGSLSAQVNEIWIEADE